MTGPCLFNPVDIPVRKVCFKRDGARKEFGINRNPVVDS